MPSTVIRAFRYLAERSQLEVTFVSGRRYRYLDVPQKTYREMHSAFSKGEFFNQRIRDNFDFERVDDDSSEHQSPPH